MTNKVGGMGREVGKVVRGKYGVVQRLRCGKNDVLVREIGGLMGQRYKIEGVVL